jgi:hypothetical protein
MARIKVEGDHSIAAMAEPDPDGDYTWTCACGYESATDRGAQPLADAINEAEVHVDVHCSLTA